MKTVPFLLIMFALTVMGLVAQKQGTPALQKQSQVLVDFRVDRKSAPPKISLASQKSILSKVFRKYLTDESKCISDFDASDGTDRLDAARKAGQIVPSI